MHHKTDARPTEDPGRGRSTIGLVRQNVYRYLCDNPGCTWQSQLSGYPERAREQYQAHVERHHEGDARMPCSRCSGEGYAGVPGHGAGEQANAARRRPQGQPGQEKRPARRRRAPAL